MELVAKQWLVLSLCFVCFAFGRGWGGLSWLPLCTATYLSSLWYFKNIQVLWILLDRYPGFSSHRHWSCQVCARFARSPLSGTYADKSHKWEQTPSSYMCVCMSIIREEIMSFQPEISLGNLFILSEENKRELRKAIEGLGLVWGISNDLLIMYWELSTTALKL